jgi:hypothetical protein
MRKFFGPASLTRNEFRLGRLLRDGEGHPAAAVPADPTPATSDVSALAGGDDFAAFEDSLSGEPADDLNNGGATPEPKADDKPAGNPPEPADEGGSAEGKDGDAAQRQTKVDDEIASLKAQLEELRQAKPADSAQKPGEQAPAVAEDVPPNPDDYPFGEADAKFIADLARHEARQEFKAQQAQQEQAREVELVETKWKTAVAAPDVIERYPDFKQKVVESANRGDWACTPLMSLGIKESDVGPDIAYHLASNPLESKRIADMHPLEQAREFGRLEGRILAERSAKAAPAPAQKVVSKAPPPPEARSRGAGGQFGTAPDTDDFSAFEGMANTVLTKKRR